MARRIIITQEDMQKLKKLIDEEPDLNKPHVRDLDVELRRAEIVDKDDVPANVITMNSRVVFTMDGAEETVDLVYPHEADISQNCISVLSPIGTAIIGYKEGDSVEWSVPDGTVIIDIKKVLYQPESAEKATRQA